MASFIQIMTTTSDKKNADRIADALIRKGLAGCVQISGPVKSTFIWEGKMKKVKEWVCLIKTVEENYSKVEVEIKSINENMVPEILSFSINKGDAAYLRWLESSWSRLYDLDNSGDDKAESNRKRR